MNLQAYCVVILINPAAAAGQIIRALSVARGGVREIARESSAGGASLRLTFNARLQLRSEVRACAGERERDRTSVYLHSRGAHYTRTCTAQ